METNKRSLVKFDFQDGFVNDTIILKINGEEILKKDNVTTDLSISLAESFSIELLNRQFKLDIIIPSKNLSLSQAIIIDSEKYFAVSIIDSQTDSPKLKIKESKDPPYYL